MARGRSRVEGLLASLDVRSTLAALATLGAQVEVVEKDGALSGSIVGWERRGPRLSDAVPANGAFLNSASPKGVFAGNAEAFPAASPLSGASANSASFGDASLNSALPNSASFGSASPGIDCGNSGTTARLLMGVLAGWQGSALLSGDPSLSRRPMRRVTAPLSQMGARFSASSQRGEEHRLPLIIRGDFPLKAISYDSPVASAQVKSAVLLAGLRAQGTTSVTEPALSRNHTELLLPAYGVSVASDGRTASVVGGQWLSAADMRVPGDPSSAAFMLVAGALIPRSEVAVRGVLLNPTRNGFLDVMRRMGAHITVRERDDWHLGAERVGDVALRHVPQLRATEVAAAELPSLIDEVPILALLATAATGITVFKGAGELRVKESDRLTAIVSGLNALGFAAWATGDDLLVKGGTPHPTSMPLALGDHRLAMTWAIASAAFGLDLKLDGREAVAVSYPGFFVDLQSLCAGA
jgi:3-phosphoshikimate 1-carboxyvinyltransferase